MLRNLWTALDRSKDGFVDGAIVTNLGGSFERDGAATVPTRINFFEFCAKVPVFIFTWLGAADCRSFPSAGRDCGGVGDKGEAFRWPLWDEQDEDVERRSASELFKFNSIIFIETVEPDRTSLDFSSWGDVDDSADFGDCSLSIGEARWTALRAWLFFPDIGRDADTFLQKHFKRSCFINMSWWRRG